MSGTLPFETLNLIYVKMDELISREQIIRLLPLVVVAIVCDIACLVLAYFVGDPEDRPLNWLAVLLAMGLSVPVGYLLSPLGRNETLQFNTIGKALLTFLSGYLVSKLDQSIEKVLSPDFLLSPTGGFRVAAFVLCFGIGVPAIYVARRQWSPRDADEPKSGSEN